MKRVLLIIIKIIGLCLLSPFIFASIGLFFARDFSLAVFIMLLVGVIPSFFIIMSLAKTRKHHATDVQDVALPEKTNNVSVRKKKKEKDHSTTSNHISLTDFNKIRAFQAKQLLESIYILETTKTLDTLSGRIDFISKIYANFIPASKLTIYQSLVEEAIDTYKVMYYDRITTENQVSLLLYPNIDKMRWFCSDCIVNCYERYVEYQITKMNELKTNTARVKRREDMIAKGNFARDMFNTYSLPDIGHLDSIENIRKRI